MGQQILGLIRGRFHNRISIMQSKGVGKFRSKHLDAKSGWIY